MQYTELAIRCHLNNARILFCKHWFNLPVKVLFQADFFFLLSRLKHYRYTVASVCYPI